MTLVENWFYEKQKACSLRIHTTHLTNLSVLFLMSHLPQPLLALMSRHLVPLMLFTTGHNPSYGMLVD